MTKTSWRYHNLFPSSSVRVNLPMNEVRRLAKKKQHRQWVHHFETMMDFKETYGRFPGQRHVHRGFKIGSWLRSQITKAKLNQLPSWRHEILEKANVPRRLHVDWWDRFRDYEKWVKDHGTSPTRRKESTEYERKLFGWKNSQRRAFALGRLNREHVRAMKKADMFGSFLDRQNGKNMAELKMFLRKHKRYPLRLSPDKEEASLAAWCKRVRTGRNNPSASIRKFVTNAYVKYSWRNRHEDAWQKKYKAYVVFLEKNGRSPGKIHSDRHQFSLYIWRTHQLVLHKHNQLPQNRLRLLNKYGILVHRTKQVRY